MTFDPMKHLTLVKGKEYLEVKWRLVWLRDKHPDATILTEVMEYDRQNQYAWVKATITIPNGGTATGHKQEDANGFGDYLEKAETGAIGRALAALGFGTQFAPEYEADTIGDPVDTPVARRAPEKSPIEKARAALFATATPLGITDKQIHAWAIAKDPAYTSTNDVPESQLRELARNLKKPGWADAFKEQYPSQKSLVSTLTPAD